MERRPQQPSWEDDHELCTIFPARRSRRRADRGNRHSRPRERVQHRRGRWCRRYAGVSRHRLREGARGKDRGCAYRQAVRERPARGRAGHRHGCRERHPALLDPRHQQHHALLAHRGHADPALCASVRRGCREDHAGSDRPEDDRQDHRGCRSPDHCLGLFGLSCAHQLQAPGDDGRRSAGPGDSRAEERDHDRHLQVLGREPDADGLDRNIRGTAAGCR